MNKTLFNTLPILLCLLVPQIINANWINFIDETSVRLELNSVSTSDSEEKDIAISDINKDGWTDVIVVRRNPFSVQGSSTDVLLLNDQGVLKDSTAKYAPGFITTPTDSRDLIVADFDGDGWEDIVMVNTFGQPPVYYHNRGNNPQGEWLGLSDSSTSRLPVLTVSPIQFCAGWAGDLTGNNALDIYLSNYKASGGSEDVLLINDGNGHFTDESLSRLGSLRRSAFGTSCELYDMDNDGDNDIVKISTLYSTLPWFDNGVFVLFNDGTGNFTNWQMMTSSAPYMFTVGDLNNDDKLDMYVVDDNQDYVNLTTGFTPDNNIFHTNTILASSPRTTQFGGNVKMADLDNDGDLDVGVASADLDIPPCESGGFRKFALLRNEGVASGTLSDPYGTAVNDWNVANYDFAFLDINNDGKMDIFNGLCSTYEVMMHEYLMAPVNLSAQGEVDKITLSWDANAEGFLSSYNLYRATTNEKDSAIILSSILAPATLYQDFSVSFGQTYFYWLSAIDTLDIETNLSDVASATFNGQCSYSDSNSLNVTNITATSVTLNWMPAEDAVSYSVRGRTPGSATWVTLQVNSTTGMFDVTGLLPNTTFLWQIKKICQIAPLKESEWTPLDTFSTLPLPVCSNPNPVSTSNITTSSANLNWMAVANASSYQLFGQILGSSATVTINISSILNSFFATGLTPGTTYIWAVRTVCSGGTQTPVSDFSTIKSFTTLSVPAKGHNDLVTNLAKNEILLYPNPADEKFIIQIESGSNQVGEVQICNLEGRMVYQKNVDVEQGTTMHEVNLNNAASGVYFVNIKLEGRIINRKLIIE